MQKEMPRTLYKKLNRVREADKKLKQKLLLLEELETILMPNAIRYDIEKVQTSPVDNLAEVVIKIATLRVKIQKMQAEILQAIEDNTNWINAIDDDNQKCVLMCRYINCLTQEKTARRLNFSLRYVQKLEVKGKTELTKHRYYQNEIGRKSS